MRCICSNILTPLMALTVCVSALAQGPPAYNLGKTPTQEEIKAWDIAIGPEGKELPPGRGTAKEGAKIYAQKCAMCHGPTGTEAQFLHGRLVGGQGTLTTLKPVRTIGNYYPYATTIWDHINRAMPLYLISPDESCGAPICYGVGKAGGGVYGKEEGALTADEVYALTALLLYWNGIIKESDVMDAEALPKVQMPNRNGFLPQDPTEWKARMRIEPHIARQGSRAKPAEKKP